MKTLIAATLLALSSSGYAAEDTNSANYMLPLCQAGFDDPIYQKLFFKGRCVGILETLKIMYELEKFFYDIGQPKQPLRCVDVPSNLSPDQAVRVVVRYGELHPEETHMPFMVLATKAFEQAWPCK